MTELYLSMIVLAAAFLLICKALIAHYSPADIISREEAIGRPRVVSRIEAWYVSVIKSIRDSREYRRELLREKNRSAVLFDVRSRKGE